MPLTHARLLTYVRQSFPTKAVSRGTLNEGAPFTLAEARFYAKGLRALSDHFNGIKPLAAKNYFNLKPYRSAYLLYFFPANWAKIQAILTHTAHLFKTSKSFRILDLGSGPGSLALGALDFLTRATQSTKKEPPSFTIDFVDQSPSALQDARALASALIQVPVDLCLHNASILPHRPVPFKTAPYDLILLGDILNEVDDHRHLDLVMTLIDRYLKEHGQIVLVEPALQKTARNLQRLRDLLLRDLPTVKVLAPCLRQGTCPLNHYNGRDWCHFYSDWQRPPWLELLEKTAGLGKDWLKYSYIVLQKYDHPLVINANVGLPTTQASGGKGFHPLTQKFDSPQLWRVISNPMKRKGKQELVLCGPQGRLHLSGQFRLKSRENGDFFKLQRGDTVALNSEEWPALRGGRESWDHRSVLTVDSSVCLQE